MEQPVVVCGLGQVGRRVLEYLHAAGLSVVAIDDRCTPDELRLERVRLIRGDFRTPEILAQADLPNARGVLILTSDDLVNISTALLVRQLHPTVRIVVRLFNQNLIPRLGKAVNNTFALGVSSLTAPVLALIAMTGQALGTFSLDGERFQIAETLVHDKSSLLAHTVAEVATRHAVHAVAHIPADAPARFLRDVCDGEQIKTGDRVVLCGERRHLAPLLEDTSEEAAPHLRWASRLRRLGRMLYRTWAEIDVSVQICTIVLVTVVLASTLVYNFGMSRSLPDSLYRTISVIATGADMHERELPEGWQKVFVSALRIFGAALIAAFTAIVTNYLLRARLRGALEVRRIPDSGHIVVCGLGNVGFRVVEELLAYDERVVVIQDQREGRFVAAARRRNVALIIGDATVPEVLRQAHVASARAVVVATNNELANLEIALLVRDLNPKQRVVVRLNDPRLSETLREAANIRLALSLPALAAPAFVAALFGDRVPTVFLVHGQILAAIELAVSAEDTFVAGRVVHALAVDYRLVPVHLRTSAAVDLAALGEHRLVPGDRLTALGKFGDVTRLLRREAVHPDCAIDIGQLSDGARSAVACALRDEGWTADAADKAAGQLPGRLAGHWTRGQAEALIARLRRIAIAAELREEARA